MTGLWWLKIIRHLMNGLIALNDKLQYLYQSGLNYTIGSSNILTVSNTGCDPEFTDKTLTVNVGVNIKINCS